MLRDIFYPQLPIELILELEKYKKCQDDRHWMIKYFHKIELLPRIAQDSCRLILLENVTVSDEILAKYSDLNKLLSDIRNLENAFHSVIQGKIKSSVNLATEDIFNVPAEVIYAYKLLIKMQDNYHILIDVDHIPSENEVFEPQIFIDVDYWKDFIL